jgi:hypothetical protein
MAGNPYNYAQLTRQQLEALLYQPGLTEYEKARIADELSKRVSDELLHGRQYPDVKPPKNPAEGEGPIVSGGNNPGPIRNNPESIAPPRKGRVRRVLFILLLVIIGFVIWAASLPSRPTGSFSNGTNSSYGWQCETQEVTCDLTRARPVGSQCYCQDLSTGFTYYGFVR